MSTYSDLVLPVERLFWHLGARRDRWGQRRRSEGEIVFRWARRAIARSAATVVDDPIVAIPDGCPDHWIMNRPCVTLTVRAVLGGQRFGLGERFEVPPRVGSVTIPVPYRADWATHGIQPDLDPDHNWVDRYDFGRDQ